MSAIIVSFSDVPVMLTHRQCTVPSISTKPTVGGAIRLIADLPPSCGAKKTDMALYTINEGPKKVLITFTLKKKRENGLKIIVRQPNLTIHIRLYLINRQHLFLLCLVLPQPPSFCTLRLGSLFLACPGLFQRESQPEKQT